MGLNVGHDGADVGKDADFSGDAGLCGRGDDGLGGGGEDGFSGGGARWWVHYRLPRVCGELWEDLPNSLPFFFHFRHDVFLVSLERRSGECG